MYGLIHLYEGDGKGKTTAAVGLSVRCAGNGGSVLFTLDEAIGACSSGMIKEEELLSFLDHRPDGLEVVLTGRNPSAALRERSDYDSEIRKEKHPFDRGITGRDGIER